MVVITVVYSGGVRHYSRTVKSTQVVVVITVELLNLHSDSRVAITKLTQLIQMMVVIKVDIILSHITDLQVSSGCLV